MLSYRVYKRKLPIFMFKLTPMTSKIGQGHPSSNLTKTLLRYIHGISLGPMRLIFVELSCLQAKCWQDRRTDGQTDGRTDRRTRQSNSRFGYTQPAQQNCLIKIIWYTFAFYIKLLSWIIQCFKYLMVFIENDLQYPQSYLSPWYNVGKTNLSWDLAKRSSHNNRSYAQLHHPKELLKPWSKINAQHWPS